MLVSLAFSFFLIKDKKKIVGFCVGLESVADALHNRDDCSSLVYAHESLYDSFRTTYVT